MIKRTIKNVKVGDVLTIKIYFSGDKIDNYSIYTKYVKDSVKPVDIKVLITGVYPYICTCQVLNNNYKRAINTLSLNDLVMAGYEPSNLFGSET